MSREEYTGTIEIHRARPGVSLCVEVQDDERARVLPLPDAVVVVGSSSRAQLRISDRSVSGLHLELRAQGGLVHVLDCGSKNGTFVGGARVRDVVAGPGTVITVGRSTLVVRENAGDEGMPAAPEPLPGVFGGSALMRRVAARVRALAGLRLPVLITGESGTGKELVARALHTESSRARGPFVPLNVTCMPRELVESELFGHERGSFTGAVARRVGAFVEADGGTLFLDEIGDLPAEAQPKLLRALDGYGVRSVGGSATSSQPNVRVVAATHAPLAERVLEGAFRRDLYHRLEVFTLHLPPLRDRPGDLAPLAKALLLQAESEVGPHKGLTSRALARLVAHSWPGNVRELRNVLVRAAALAEDGVVDGAHVDQAIGVVPSVAKKAMTPALAKAILHEHAGNLSAASRASGCPRSTFRKLLAR